MNAERSSELFQYVGPGPLGSLSLAKNLLRDFSRFDSLVFTKTTRNHLMAWTEITRPKYQRDGLRYASDTTDEEWSEMDGGLDGGIAETLPIRRHRHDVTRCICVSHAHLPTADDAHLGALEDLIELGAISVF